MPNGDVEDWLPRLLREKWGASIESLLSAGKDVPWKTPPTIRGAGEKQAKEHDLVRSGPIVKVYSDSDESHVPVSIGDADRDIENTVTVTLEAAGPDARRRAVSMKRVLDRFLQLHRAHPHEDWDRFESWSIRQATGYSDYQRFIANIRLAKRGELQPGPIGAQ